MRVVVTGGTGFIGTKLVLALAARGDDVTVLTRGGARPPGPARERVRFTAWTPTTTGDWSASLADADAVVHLAGAGVMDERWTTARMAVLRSSRVDSTRVLAEAIAGAAKKPVFVSASAIGIYGFRKDDELLDESGAHGTDVLAEICEAWEAAAEPARAAGARVAHPRIGLVLGAGGGALAKMLPPFRAFVGGPLGDGQQWFSWVHWRDTVDALLFAVDSSLSGPFNVTAPDPVRMNDLAHAIGHAMHRPSAFRVPAPALRLALGDRADAILTGPRAVPRKLTDAGFAFAFTRLEEALADILARS